MSWKTLKEAWLVSPLQSLANRDLCMSMFPNSMKLLKSSSGRLSTSTMTLPSAWTSGLRWSAGGSLGRIGRLLARRHTAAAAGPRREVPQSTAGAFFLSESWEVPQGTAGIPGHFLLSGVVSARGEGCHRVYIQSLMHNV